MNRRQLLATAGCAVLPYVSGCLNDPGTNGGLLEILGADAPPNATITEASNKQLQIDPVQDGLRKAHTGNGVSEVEVTEREYDVVARALSDLPWYDRIQHNSNSISGIYIRYEGAVYVIVLTPFCIDSWRKEAQSKRGEYGWGGCIDREE